MARSTGVSAYPPLAFSPIFQAAEISAFHRPGELALFHDSELALFDDEASAVAESRASGSISVSAQNRESAGDIDVGWLFSGVDTGI